jgi:hypothetical protein
VYWKHFHKIGEYKGVKLLGVFTHGPGQMFTKKPVTSIKDVQGLKIRTGGGGDLSRASFWTGLRPATPDGTPVVGATQYSNLFLNTGHGTLGWTMACGSGRYLADLMASRMPQISAGQIGSFKIDAETGVAAGVRRIEAVTGPGV